MCHPHARMTQSMIERHFDRVCTNWDGALFLYEKLRKFLFGHVEFVDEESEVLELHQILYNEPLE